MLFRSGTKEQFSHLGYGCLAYLLARSAKTTYAKLLSDKILKPLGMEDTYYSLSLNKRHLLATGYRGIGPVSENFVDKDTSFFKPVVGLISTIADLRKWLSFFLRTHATALDPYLKQVFRFQKSGEDEGVKKSGLGWEVEPFSTSLVTYKGGGVYCGFSSCMLFTPDTKTGVVVLSNTEYDVEPLARELLQFLNS